MQKDRKIFADFDKKYCHTCMQKGFTEEVIKKRFLPPRLDPYSFKRKNVALTYQGMVRGLC
jgi:dTDP-4-dehydrorhamnose 3,5-epimerase-like enzyme